MQTSIKAGAEAQGIETLTRVGGINLEEILPGKSGLVCFSRNTTLSALFLPHASSPAGLQCHGTDEAEATSVYFSPDYSALGSSRESLPGQH